MGYTNTYWIVKNHWENNWGENGYMSIKRSTNGTPTATSCYIGNVVTYLNPQVSEVIAFGGNLWAITGLVLVALVMIL